MMKKLLLQITILGLYGSQNISNAQGGTANNFRASGAQFLGWNTAGFSGTLNIRNDFNDRINFSTNGFNRMFIDNGAVGITAGRIAMGNNLPANFAPQARLHLHHTGGGNTNLLFTNVVTGATLNDGLEIGMTVTS